MSPAYSRSQTRGTTNSNDGIFDSDMIVPLTGDYTDGYSGAIDIGLQDLPDEGSTDDPDTTTPDEDTTVAASLAGVKTVSRQGGSRAVVATVKTREKAGDRRAAAPRRQAAASQAHRPAGQGSASGDARVGRGVAAGSADPAVIVTDSSGNRKTLQRRVSVPRLKS